MLSSLVERLAYHRIESHTDWPGAWIRSPRTVSGGISRRARRAYELRKPHSSRKATSGSTGRLHSRSGRLHLSGRPIASSACGS